MRHVHLVLLLALIAPIGARSAHANDVTVKVAGGTLKLKGDADGNSLSLDQSGLLTTQVRVNGNNISTINGTGPVVGARLTYSAGSPNGVNSAITSTATKRTKVSRPTMTAIASSKDV